MLAYCGNNSRISIAANAGANRFSVIHKFRPPPSFGTNEAPALPCPPPSEVAAPSKRGPSAFILASLIETELNLQGGSYLLPTLLPLAQASEIQKGQVDGNQSIAG